MWILKKLLLCIERNRDLNISSLKKTERCRDKNLGRDEILSCVVFSIAPTKKSRHIIAKTHVGRAAIGAAEEAEQSLDSVPRELEQRKERERE